jgi:hypothetical protein
LQFGNHHAARKAQEEILMAAPFIEALNKLLERLPVPAQMTSRDWAGADPAIRDRSFFSALVESLRFLDEGKGTLTDALSQATEEVVAPDGTRSIALKEGGKAKFIEKMREIIRAEGMAGPDEFKKESGEDVTNIGSRRRLDLIFNTQIQTSFGFADWQQGMDPEILAAYPAARFIRTGPVMEPRPRHAVSEGAVQLKSDFAFWAEFQNDPEIGGFGVPWGPFGYNSEMGQEDVPRREAERLGLLAKGQAVPVPDASEFGRTKAQQYNHGIAAKEPVDPVLKDKLREIMRRKYGPGSIGKDGRVTIDPLKMGA